MVRFYDVSLTEFDLEECGLDVACMTGLYNRVLFPVLCKASSKVLHEVPVWYNLHDNVHFVGCLMQSKHDHNDLLPQPIIIRFSKKLQIILFLKLKRDYMPFPTATEITFSRQS